MASEKRKISTKIWRPVVDKLTRKLNKACLRRDAFLERVLDVELPYLDNEVALPNSEQAQNFIAERLDHLDRKLVSLALRIDLIERLESICGRKRIVRDAFFNRLFLLLAAPPGIIDKIFFNLDSDDWRTEVWSELKHDGPFFQNVFYPLEQEIDPFWSIRAGLELHCKESDLLDYKNPDTGESVKVVKLFNEDRVTLPSRVYTVVLSDKEFGDADLYGLNCYLPDWHISGHPAESKFRKDLDKLLGVSL